MQEPEVQPLVGELRSHMLQSMNKKKKLIKKKDINLFLKIPQEKYLRGLNIKNSECFTTALVVICLFLGGFFVIDTIFILSYN